MIRAAELEHFLNHIVAEDVLHKHVRALLPSRREGRANDLAKK